MSKTKTCERCNIEIGFVRHTRKYCENCVKEVKKQSSYNTKSKAKSTVEGYLRYLTYGERKQYFSHFDLFDIYERQKGLCAISGVPMTHMDLKNGTHCPTNISVDRINSEDTYRLGNIQLACYIANNMKNTLTMQELHWWCEQIMKVKN